MKSDMSYLRCNLNSEGDRAMTIFFLEKLPKLKWWQRLLGYRHEHCKSFDYKFQKEYKQNGIIKGVK